MGGQFKCFKFMGKEQSRGFLLKGTGWRSLCVSVCEINPLKQAFLMPGIVLEVVTVVGRVFWK